MMPSELNLAAATLLGEGSEAQVYALDATRIVRLFREDASAEYVGSRTAFLVEIAAGARHLPFETPLVLDQGEAFGRIYTLEKRIAGTSLLQILQGLHGRARRRLVTQYLDAAWQLGDIKVERPFWGDLCRSDAIQAPTWRGYLVERARRSLAGSPFVHVDADELIASIDKPNQQPAFVHLDYSVGNTMAANGQLNAVIDFGYSSIIGDRRMNLLVAAAYLVTPHITPTVTSADQTLVYAWLREHDLMDYYEQHLRWLAAYWVFANSDPSLFKWCRSLLA